MRENSFLPSEEPQGQHQGEGAQGKLWRLKKILRQLSRRSKYVQEYQFLPTEETQGQHQGDCVPGFSRRFIGILRFWSNIQVIGNWDNRSSYFRLVISLKSHLETFELPEVLVCNGGSINKRKPFFNFIIIGGRIIGEITFFK